MAYSLRILLVCVVFIGGCLNTFKETPEISSIKSKMTKEIALHVLKEAIQRIPNFKVYGNIDTINRVDEFGIYFNWSRDAKTDVITTSTPLGLYTLFHTTDKANGTSSMNFIDVKKVRFHEVGRLHRPRGSPKWMIFFYGTKSIGHTYAGDVAFYLPILPSENVNRIFAAISILCPNLDQTALNEKNTQD